MTESKPMVTFPEAIKSCLRQYVGFTGRATRAEYWWWVLGTVVVSILIGIVDGIIFGFDGGAQPLSMLFGLAIVLPGLAVTARRLHDIGRTGWWQLVWFGVGILGVLPVTVGILLSLGGLFALFSGEADFAMGVIMPVVVGLVISLAVWIGLAVWEIWWLVTQGQTGPNRHGADPRAWDA